MSGMRTTWAAPARSACAATRSASPPGGWPLGRCPTPGGGWVSVFILMCNRVLSAGRLFSASAYNPPEAMWVTGRNGAATLTTNVWPAAWAGTAGRSAAATAVVTVSPRRLRRDIGYLAGIAGAGSSRGDGDPDPHRAGSPVAPQEIRDGNEFERPRGQLDRRRVQLTRRGLLDRATRGQGDGNRRQPAGRDRRAGIDPHVL